MSFVIYYCRDCGNYTYFKFYAKHVYNASLQGILYSNIENVSFKIEKVVCKMCGSENVDKIIVKFASDVPNLRAFQTLKPEDRIKAFDNLKEELKRKYGEK